MKNPSVRQVYVVTYDISDSKRLRKVYKTLLGRGDHVQLSVFLCQLNRRELLGLQIALDEIIDHSHDQVLFIDLGPAAGRARTAVTALGRPCITTDRHAIVV